jgi:glucose/arabinose dehydrogenase
VGYPLAVSRRRAAVAAFVLLAVLVPSLPVLTASPASASTFPSGFTDTKVAGALGTPTAVAQLPDGRMLVTSQTGQLHLVTNGTVTTALDLAALSKICTDDEEGLLGVAVDPQFGTNGHIYLYYTASVGSCALNGASPGGAKNRVSRFTMSGSTVNAGSETILLDNMPEYGGNHNGGELHISNDGHLFVGVGDGGAGRPDTNPADLSMPNGKVLRINLDGSIPGDNPHGTTVCKTSWGPPGSPKVCGEIWADGLRNPFRFGWDAAAPGAKFRIDDVGDATWEEVDAGVAGAHYGWPCREGPAAHASTAACNMPETDPLLWYNHSTGCNVETGGAFVPPGTWAGKDGDYLFVDFGCGDLFIATPGQTGAASTTLATGMDMTTDLEFFQVNGTYELFYTTYKNGGQLREVIGPSPTPPPSTVPDTKFTAIQPTRVLDTRTGTGVAAGHLPPGSAITVKVTGGAVPDAAKAVALNLTATNADGPGFVTAWPTGEAQPATSSLNLSNRGETAANAVVVPIGQNGQINLVTLGGTDLIADVTGYFKDVASSTDGRFQAASTPTRLLDTRNGTGGKSGAFQPHEQFDLAVTGRAGVPLDATAVALTVTYTDVAQAGFITVWPTGQPLPNASTSNPNGPGDIRSNLALIALGTGGKVSIVSLSRADVVVDLVGWFAPGTGTHGLFTAVTPERVADSRQPGAPFPRIATGSEVAMDFTGAPGLSSAVLYNLTATNTIAGGFITAHPAGTPLPAASSVNWSAAGQSRAALTVSSLASSNTVDLAASSSVDAVIDVSGWFEE